MTTNKNWTTPFIATLLANFLGVLCLLFLRSYRIDQAEVERLSADIHLTETLVQEINSKKDALTPEQLDEARQQFADLQNQVVRLQDRLSEIKAAGPDSLAAKSLECSAFGAMLVSIFAGGLFMYRRTMP